MKLYQNSIAILSGAAAVGGLATLLSGDAISINAKSLDEQIAINHNTIVAQARTPLDDYLQLFRDFVDRDNIKGYNDYEKSSSNRRLVVLKGVESDNDEGIPFNQDQTILYAGKSEYRMRKAGRNYEFSFTDENIDPGKGLWNIFYWNLNPRFETIGFFRGQGFRELLYDRHPVALDKMSQENRTHFGQFDKRFLELLEGMRKFK